MVDPADAPVKDSIMIAFLPVNADWCNEDLPHMTLVYAGKIADRGPADFSAMAKDTASLAALTRPFTMRVAGVEIFGDTEQVKVLRFRPQPEVMAARRFVEQWNASQFPFNAHATIGPIGTPTDFAPSSVGFNKILLAWGEDQLIFQLNYS